MKIHECQTVNIRYYIDEYGFPRAEIGSPYESVGLLLVSEIGRSLYNCKQLLSAIERAKSGVESEWNGEAHQVTITGDKVIIENEYSHPLETCEMSLNEFEKALTQWFEFILIGQEDQLEWVEKMMMREAELPRIREQRIKRKLMASKKRNARKRGV